MTDQANQWQKSEVTGRRCQDEDEDSTWWELWVPDDEVQRLFATFDYEEDCDLVVSLQQQLEAAQQQEQLALAHDTQPYPTAAAYEAVCKARDNWQAEAEKRARELEAALAERNNVNRAADTYLDRAEAAESRLAATERERDRLRERTHEIQERADKELGSLRRLEAHTKTRARDWRRDTFHPDDGSPDARTAYWYLWDREKKRLAGTERKLAEAVEALQMWTDIEDHFPHEHVAYGGRLDEFDIKARAALASTEQP